MASDGVVMVVNGRSETIATFDRYDKELLDSLAKEIESSAKDIMAGVIFAAPSDSGALVASVGIRKKGRFTRLIAPKAQHGGMVEYGIGTLGKRRQKIAKYPSPSGLKEWAISHGLNPFAVARSMFKRQGFGAKPFLAPSFLAERDAFVDRIQRTIQEVTARTEATVPGGGGK